MKRIYDFLLTVLLVFLAVVADLLAYITVRRDFLIIGLLVLLISLVLSIVMYGTWVSKVFRMLLFSITLISGIVLFQLLLPIHIVAVMLIIGSIGFITILTEHKKRKPKRHARKIAEPPLPEPSLPSPVEPEPRSTQAMQSLAVMESLDRDDEFLELDEVDKLVQKKRKAAKNVRKKVRKRKNKKK